MKKPYFILLSSIAILSFYFIFYNWSDKTFAQTERLSRQNLPRKEGNHRIDRFSSTPHTNIFEQRDVSQISSATPTTKRDRIKADLGKIILFYTDYLGSRKWPRISAESRLKELDGTPCNAGGPCSVTYDKDKVNASDAVVFHEPSLPSSTFLQRLRKQVSSRQIWIWNLREPPYHLTRHPLSYVNVFNWTCTYSLMSEVYDPIFHIIPVGIDGGAVTSDNNRITFNQGTRTFNTPDLQKAEYNNTSTIHSREKHKLKNKVSIDKKNNSQYKDFASEKSKMIFTAINNCLKPRLEMIKELRKYVSIDVYGRCGKLVGDTHLPKCKRFSKSCATIMSKYKFSFSMENSYCDYYVTEKYYQNGLQYGLVPIVLGGAVYSDPKFALQHSFINIKNFENLQSLGTYLKYLNSNDTAYNEYFWWRTKYKVTRKSKACSICKQLWRRTTGDTGQNIGDFWNINKSCKDWSIILKKYLKK